MSTPSPASVLFLNPRNQKRNGSVRGVKLTMIYISRDFGVRGAGAFSIRCGKLAQLRESDWLSLVKILMYTPRGTPFMVR